MKKIVKYLTFLLIPTYCYSQEVKTSTDFDINIGPPYKKVEPGINRLFYYKGKVLALKIQSDMNVQTFETSSLSETSRSIVSGKEQMPRGYNHEDFIQKDGIVFEFFNIKGKEIFVREFHFENPIPTNNRLVYAEESRIGITQLYQSFDKSKTVLIHKNDAIKGKDNSKHDNIGMILFDENMKKIGEHNVIMPYPSDNMYVLSYTVDSNGNVYILTKVTTDAKAHLEIIKCDKDAKLTSIKISDNGKIFSYEFQLKESSNGNIYCMGYYGDNVYEKGIYTSTLLKDGKITNEKFHDIPLNIINYNTNPDEKKAGIYSLKLRNINFNPDGSIILLGEIESHVVSLSRDSEGNSVTTVTYFFKDILCAKFDINNNLVWINRLVKREQGYHTTYLSFGYLECQNNHYLFYMDYLKNENFDLDKYPEVNNYSNKGRLVFFKINDKTGEVSKEKLFDELNKEVATLSGYNKFRFVQIEENVVLLEMSKKKKEDVLLRIKLKSPN